MPVISEAAVLNNINLSYRAIVFRESVAFSCSSYFPFTEELQHVIGERVGMSPTTASKCVKELEEAGELAVEGRVMYLLKLDPFQLNGIEERNNYQLLETLAVAGCVEAAERVVAKTENPRLLQKIVEKYEGFAEPKKTEKVDILIKQAKRKVAKIELKVSKLATSDAFLLHFFMFASCQKRGKSFQIGNSESSEVAKNEAKVSKLATTYKEYYEEDLKPEDYEKSGNSPRENSTHAPDDNSTGSLPAGKPTNAAPKKPRSSAGKPADLRIDHPAVKMVNEITGRFPKKEIWDRLIREIGDKPDIEFFRKCFEIWVSFDGNPQNYDQWIFKTNEEKKYPERFERTSKKTSDEAWKSVGKNDGTFPHIPNREAEPEERDLLLPNVREEVLNQAIVFAERKDVYALTELEMELHPDDWRWIQTQLAVLKTVGA